MGEVYDAVRLEKTGGRDDEAAIKLVHPQLLVEHDVVERFLREAKVTSSLSVPNVVRVIDASAPNAPIPYLAMERLEEKTSRRTCANTRGCRSGKRSA